MFEHDFAMLAAILEGEIWFSRTRVWSTLNVSTGFTVKYLSKQ